MNKDLCVKILFTFTSFGTFASNFVGLIYISNQNSINFTHVVAGAASFIFIVFGAREFLRSLKGYKWWLQLNTLFDSTKMLVELTDFQNEKYHTIVSKKTLTGFVYPETRTGRIVLRSDGSVLKPIYITWWQPTRQDLKTEHYLKNYDKLQMLQNRIRKKAV